MNEKAKEEDKIVNLLSFASRMGKLIYGKERLERYLNGKGERWLFLASDCSSNTQTYWEKKCQSMRCELFVFSNLTKKGLAKRLGKKELSVVSTSNTDIINGIRNLLESR